MENKMESPFVKITSDCVLSPLGLTTAENFENVLAGKTGLKTYDGLEGIESRVCTSKFNRDAIESLFERSVGQDARGEYTFFEKLCILSILGAAKDINLSRENVVFVLSTTKGNIEFLERDLDDARCRLGESARRISSFFGNPNTPIVVSNACISGANALLVAARLLKHGGYRRAVVTGCDVVGRFTLSGFGSFRAMSADPCRPFDAARCGLNLGEAAATVILEAAADITPADTVLIGGAIANDANHISGPSRDAVGAVRAVREVSEKIPATEKTAFISLHGTATIYNDEMEATAIAATGLGKVPACGLKGFYGHTLGAAGVIETALSIRALKHDTVIGTKGFSGPGTACPLNISAENRPTSGNIFLKMLSGFGGTNAVIAVGHNLSPDSLRSIPQGDGARYTCVKTVRILPDAITVDGATVFNGTPTEYFRQNIGSYPKFFKMDGMSRLGFVAGEILLNELTPEQKKDVKLIFFNKASSLATDRNFQQTIRRDSYYPSPALFVYTLPNIVQGELAIRHGITAETAFYVLPSKDPLTMRTVADASLADSDAPFALYGWIDCESDTDFEAELHLLRKY